MVRKFFPSLRGKGGKKLLSKKNRNRNAMRLLLATPIGRILLLLAFIFVLFILLATLFTSTGTLQSPTHTTKGKACSIETMAQQVYQKTEMGTGMPPDGHKPPKNCGVPPKGSWDAEYIGGGGAPSTKFCGYIYKNTDYSNVKLDIPEEESGVKGHGKVRGDNYISWFTDQRGIENMLSSPLGTRKDPETGKSKFHAGEDYGMPVNTKVYAMMDGVVLESNFPCNDNNMLKSDTTKKCYEGNGGANSSGNFVKLKGAYHGQIYYYTYMHLSEDKEIAAGTTVKAGEYIVDSGNTGKSFGAHLHVETSAGTPTNLMSTRELLGQSDTYSPTQIEGLREFDKNHPEAMDQNYRKVKRNGEEIPPRPKPIKQYDGKKIFDIPGQTPMYDLLSKECQKSVDKNDFENKGLRGSKGGSLNQCVGEGAEAVIAVGRKQIHEDKICYRTGGGSGPPGSCRRGKVVARCSRTDFGNCSDCSSFVSMSFFYAGYTDIEPWNTTRSYLNTLVPKGVFTKYATIVGPTIPAEAQPGDVIIQTGCVEHAILYIGNGIKIDNGSGEGPYSGVGSRRGCTNHWLRYNGFNNQTGLSVCGAGTVDDIKKYAKDEAAKIGWGGSEWKCLDDFWTKLNNWQVKTDKPNPTTNTYGINCQSTDASVCQSLPGFEPRKENGYRQVDFGLKAIRNNNTTPCKLLESIKGGEAPKENTPSGNALKDYLKKTMPEYGFDSEEDFKCLSEAWGDYTNWNPTWVSADGMTCGISQLDCNSLLYSAGKNWSEKPETQIRFGLQKLQESKGKSTPCSIAKYNRKHGQNYPDVDQPDVTGISEPEFPL